MLTLMRSDRFDDTDEAADYAYHGVNHHIGGELGSYQVRLYDDEPGIATVIAPADARTLGEAGDLVALIQSQFGARTIRFYRAAATGAPYAAIDPDTLEFK